MLIRGLTISGGYAAGNTTASESGGAILNYGRLEVYDATLDYNHAMMFGGASPTRKVPGLP